MRTTILTLLGLIALAAPSAAATGTCTITVTRQTGVGESDFGFGIPKAAGVAMPVEFDEASGAFSMSRDAWYAQFGDTGADFDTIGGILGFLRMKPGTDTGTIESDGTAAFPSFQADFATTLGTPMPPYPDLPIEGLSLTTGVNGGAITGLSGTKRGSPIDFATGSMTLVGVGIVRNAPGVSGLLLTGIEMTCTLSPVPDAASLPAPAVFTKIRGKAKSGANGDTLTLKAVAGKPALPLAFATATHLVLNVVPAGTEAPVLSVRIAALTASGKKLVASRDDTCKVKRGAAQGLCKRDGSTVCTAPADCADDDVVDVLVGRKPDAGVSAKIAVAEKSKGTNVTAKLGGIDLAALSGSVTLELWVAGRAATGTATASGGSKKRIK